MPQLPKPVSQSSSPSRGNPASGFSGQSGDISKDMVKFINALSGGLQTYPIRELVKHSESFGGYLAQQNVKTNQLRKFLDAINRIKADLTLEDNLNLKEVEVSLQMLKPKLAYAVARADKRQSKAVSDLKDIISNSIDKIKLVQWDKTDNAVSDEDEIKEFRADFERLVNLIESIIAYHKAEGGE
jgi:CRISPR-associated protein Csm2